MELNLHQKTRSINCSTECPNIIRELYNGEGEVKIPGFLANYDSVGGDKTGIQALKFNL